MKQIFTVYQLLHQHVARDLTVTMGMFNQCIANNRDRCKNILYMTTK